MKNLYHELLKLRKFLWQSEMPSILRGANENNQRLLRKQQVETQVVTPNVAESSSQASTQPSMDYSTQSPEDLIAKVIEAFDNLNPENTGTLNPETETPASDRPLSPFSFAKKTADELGVRLTNDCRDKYEHEDLMKRIHFLAECNKNVRSRQ